jgi:hypothetical protein
MTTPGYLNAYLAGDTLLIVPMAGWGGAYKEQEEQERIGVDDAGLEAVLARTLDISDVRPGGFDRDNIPQGKTGYARAGAMARRKGAPLRCFSLTRDEAGVLTLQLLGPVPGQRGLMPEGPQEHPQSLAEAVQHIRARLQPNDN